MVSIKHMHIHARPNRFSRLYVCTSVYVYMFVFVYAIIFREEVMNLRGVEGRGSCRQGEGGLERP